MACNDMATLCGADLLGDNGAQVTGVAIDSREVQPGNLFVALPGNRVDGHDYAADAVSRGAAAVLLARDLPVNAPRLLAGDPSEALGRLAAGWRGRFDLPVLGITGSNGKTSVKNMLRAILAPLGQVVATSGNQNNELGVPLTLLQIDSNTRFAVVEMGARHVGDIARLCEWVRPDVGLVTQCAPAHLSVFGSIEAVAEGKGEMFSGTRADGVAVINADDRYRSRWQELAGERRQVLFGLSVDADVRAEQVRVEATKIAFRLDAFGDVREVSFPLVGKHNVMNALAATAVAIAAGVRLDDCIAGLSMAKLEAGRLQFTTGSWGGVLIDDSYNANPASSKAAIEVLATQSGERWLMLGDMAELGDAAAELHVETGRFAAEQGIEKLLAAGQFAAHTVAGFGAKGRAFADVDQLLTALPAALPQGVAVLVKGSRSARMERVVEFLQRGAGPC